MAVSPAASPSKPSAMFTPLTVASSSKTAKANQSHVGKLSGGDGTIRHPNPTQSSAKAI